MNDFHVEIIKIIMRRMYFAFFYKIDSDYQIIVLSYSQTPYIVQMSTQLDSSYHLLLFHKYSDSKTLWYIQ